MIQEVRGRKLLFVDDDTDLRDTMVRYFSARQNEVFSAGNLADARMLFRNAVFSDTLFDAIVLDVILPDGDGLEFLKELEHIPPVIILSSLGSESDMLSCFFSGAVDYIVKPCSMQLLETRLALRLLPKPESCITIHHLKLDTRRRTVTFKGQVISLTGSEFNILHFLMLHPDEFFRSEEIYENVWKAPSLQTTTIKRHLSTLRCKLKEVTNCNLIITEFGKGYCFPLGNGT